MARNKSISDKKEIIRTAMELLEQEGITALSIRRIGSGLNVSGMTLYNYIENIDEVKREVILEGFRRLYKEGYESLRALKENNRSISFQIGCKVLAKVLYDFGVNHCHLYELMFCGHGGRFKKDAEISPFYGFFHNHFNRSPDNSDNCEYNRALNMLDHITNSLILEQVREVKPRSEESFFDYINEFIEKMFKGNL